MGKLKDFFFGNRGELSFERENLKMESRSDNEEVTVFWYPGRVENYDPSNQRRIVLRGGRVGKERKL